MRCLPLRRNGAALALFLADTGCRLGEALRAKREDIGECNGLTAPIVIHSEKGGDERVSYVTRDTMKRLPHSGPLFTHSRRKYQRDFARAGTSAHAFRRWMITTLLDSGADIRSVQDMVGHSKVDSTALYWLATEERLHALSRSIALLPRYRRDPASFVDWREGRLDP